MADGPRFRPERRAGRTPWTLLVLLGLVGSALIARAFWPAPARPPTLVTVRGDVPSPGTYALEKATVHTALRAAGAEPPAGQDAVVPAGHEVVHEHGETRIEPPQQPLLVALPVDPNTATVEQLVALPGVGEGTARRLIARRPYRDERSLERAVGRRNWETLAPFVSLSEVALVDLNAATVGELESLPGVGPVLAARIVVDRADHGPYTRVEDLERVDGVGPALVEKLRLRVRP